MRDVNRDAALAANADHFLNGSDEADGIRAFVADMGIVDAALAGSNFRELNDLLGCAEVLWRVKETGGEPEGALVHRLFHQTAHAVELGRSGRAGRRGQNFLAHRAVADQEPDVGTDAGSPPFIKSSTDVKRARAIVTGNYRGNALAEIVFIGAVARIGQVFEDVRVRIDEPGADNKPLSFDGAGGADLRL